MGTLLENALAEARIIHTFEDASRREGYIVALADEVLRLRAQLGLLPPPFIVHDPENMEEALQKIGGLQGALVQVIQERNDVQEELNNMYETWF